MACIACVSRLAFSHSGRAKIGAREPRKFDETNLVSLICTVTLATTAALLELYTQQKKFKIIALILQCLHKVSLAGD